MSPDARRRFIRIVAPLTQNQEKEIIGGLKNALERGENLAKAKQSFINAGYKPEDVEAAAQKMPTTSKTNQSGTEQTAVQPKAQPAQPAQTAAQPKTQAMPTTTTKTPGQKKSLSKKTIIILVSSAILVFIAAAILGIFWNKIS